MELQSCTKLVLNTWFQSVIYLYTGSKYVNDPCQICITNDLTSFVAGTLQFLSVVEEK